MSASAEAQLGKDEREPRVAEALRDGALPAEDGLRARSEGELHREARDPERRGPAHRLAERVRERRPS